MKSTKEKIIMQMRCVACKKEQYSMAVYGVSHGTHGCSWCGVIPKVYTSKEDYWKDYDALTPQK